MTTVNTERSWERRYFDKFLFLSCHKSATTKNSDHKERSYYENSYTTAAADRQGHNSHDTHWSVERFSRTKRSTIEYRAWWKKQMMPPGQVHSTYIPRAGTARWTPRHCQVSTRRGGVSWWHHTSGRPSENRRPLRGQERSAPPWPRWPGRV